jgi:hypothetical protein
VNRITARRVEPVSINQTVQVFADIEKPEAPVEVEQRYEQGPQSDVLGRH